MVCASMSALARQVRLFVAWVDYTRRFRPKLVIWENVVGLLKKPRLHTQIPSVRMVFEGLGYSFAYTQLDTRILLLLQRRARIWM